MSTNGLLCSIIYKIKENMFDNIELKNIFNGLNHYKDLTITINNKKYFFIKDFLFKFYKKSFDNRQSTIAAYIILNSTDGHFYVGSSFDIFRRVAAHRCMLSSNTHRCKKLQNSYNNTNKAMIDICVIFLDTREEAYEIEQYILDFYKGDDKLTNSATNALLAGKDRINNDEFRRKMSLYNKNRIVSQETRNKLSVAGMGRKMSDQTKKLLIKINTGRTVSQETRNKISLAQKGKIIKPETILKISAKLRGVPRSQATKDKISLSHKNNPRFNIDVLKNNNILKSKSVSINGIKYNSINDAARNLNSSGICVSNRCKSFNLKFKDWFFI